MAKILLHAYCVTNPDNSYAKREVFYTTGLTQSGGQPISYENTTTITCSPFTLPQGTELERYCALAADGTGVMRVITATGIEFTNYTRTDTPSSACDGTCDLNAPYVTSTPTSATTAADGTIRLDVTTSYPPITAFNPQLGSPTTQILSTPAGITPATYIVQYNNVRAGTYAIQLQDNGNCQFTTSNVTVAAGAAPGTGTPGLPGNIDWFKYQLIGSAANNGNGFATTLQVSGYAWNKTTKQGYAVAPIAVNYPEFWDSTVRYPAGAIVRYTHRVLTLNVTTYHRAKSELVANDFITNNRRIPVPTGGNLSDTYWEALPVFSKSTLRFVRLTGISTATEYDYFYSPPRHPQATALTNYYYYEDGAVVRYGWDGFYRAKGRLDSRNFQDGRIPTPTAGATDNNWEKIDDFAPFYYAIPEAEIMDQYASGSLSRNVRFHTYDPSNPIYTPTSVGWIQCDPTAGTPPQGNDYILFDDTTPTVETSLGDLKVIDVIKNDVDDTGAENGSVAILAVSPSLPIGFHLRNGVRPGYPQDNRTGVYENLSPGSYVVDVTDADGRYTSVAFVITDNYGKRWRLLFDDPTGQPLSIFIYERNWIGDVTDVIGTGKPVVLSWDSGSDPGGYIPEAVGANLDFEVLTEIAQQFVDTALRDDRSHRADYYRDGKLQFRGYLSATQYQERMLGPGQSVKMVATDGLGQLKSTQFINHLSERQLGRTSMLSILLKCLSFCDVNLPVLVGVNLRDRLMSADGDPLLEAFVQRNAYEKKDGKVIKAEDLIDCRTVINAILQVFNAFLFQADGCWKIIALNEVHDPFAVRAYSPAGTLLPTFDTTSPPLRILEAQYATAAREMFWLNANQTRTVVASAQIVKTVVPLQLEDNLFSNGEFLLWDAANTRPLYWTVTGTPTVTRTKGEKSKEYAVRFANYTTAFVPGSYLLSPPVPHLTGQDEDGMQVKMRATLQATTTNPAELKASVFFQVVCDGTPYGTPVEVEMGTKDKWKDYSFYLPLGLPGTSVRIRVIKPQASDAASADTTVTINRVALSIQPGLVDWSDQQEDHAEATNIDLTGIRLPDVELVHADLPRLPNTLGNPLPPKKMDVFAWRHAVTLADYTATTGWSRPASPLAYSPLLENAAQDRMTLRAVPANVVTGDVKGPGVEHLRVGLMLDMPEDMDGRFLVISCFKDEHKRTATITCRRLADGDYGGVNPDLPDFGRGARKNTKSGYRVASTNGVELFRIAAL